MAYSMVGSALKKLPQQIQKPDTGATPAPVQATGSPQTQAPKPQSPFQVTGQQPAVTPQTPAPAPTPAAMPGILPNPGGIQPITGATVSPINPQNDLRHTTIAPDNTGAPSLSGLAASRFKDIMAGSADERQQGIRAIGQSAAKFGRIGAGMTTNQLTSLEDLLQRRENESARDLAFGSATGDLAERRAQRGEVRGERDFQVGLDREAQDRAIQQRMMEDALTNSEFGRSLATANFEYGAGQDQQGQGSDALGAFAEYLFNRNRGKKPEGSQTGGEFDPSNILYSEY